jgi:hypothetical protein
MRTCTEAGPRQRGKRQWPDRMLRPHEITEEHTRWENFCGSTAGAALQAARAALPIADYRGQVWDSHMQLACVADTARLPHNIMHADVASLILLVPPHLRLHEWWRLPTQGLLAVVHPCGSRGHARFVCSSSRRSLPARWCSCRARRAVARRRRCRSSSSKIASLLASTAASSAASRGACPCSTCPAASPSSAGRRSASPSATASGWRETAARRRHCSS